MLTVLCPTCPAFYPTINPILTYHLHKTSKHPLMQQTGPPTSRPSPQSPTLSDRIKDFITQRATQTVLFYSLQLRDETSFHWLEDFLEHTGLYDMHHFDCLKKPWREYILTLFRTPTEKLIIKKPIAGRGRATAINPYIPKKYFEYFVEIEPRKIGGRLLSCRGQLAKECMEDLKLIERENVQALERRRLDVVKVKSVDEMRVSFPPLDFDPAFNAATPFRGGTYDLLKKYLTYLAARQVLFDLERNGDEGVKKDAVWFKEFCDSKGSVLREVESGYGSGEMFVDLLLDSSPAVRSGGAFLDPMRLAQDVMSERQKIADYWVQILGTTDDDHLSIERELVEGSWV